MHTHYQHENCTFDFDSLCIYNLQYCRRYGCQLVYSSRPVCRISPSNMRLINSHNTLGNRSPSGWHFRIWRQTFKHGDDDHQTEYWQFCVGQYSGTARLWPAGQILDHLVQRWNRCHGQGNCWVQCRSGTEGHFGRRGNCCLSFDIRRRWRVADSTVFKCVFIGHSLISVIYAADLFIANSGR